MLISQIISKIEFSKRFFVVGIDGPTASGKTCLANNLSIELSKQNIPYFIFRLDWTLKERKLRENEIDLFVENKSKFEYEADYHMDMSRAIEFLDDFVGNFKLNRKINITGLYNRQDGGKCNGSADLVMQENMVLIIEGHYTHLPELNKNIDYNLLLLAKPDELLKRKINRAGIYRNSEKIKDYFDYVDMPSFYHYSCLWFNNFSAVLDNTDYKKPTFCENDKIIPFLNLYSKNNCFQNLNVVNDFFSVSKLRDKQTEQVIFDLIKKCFEFDYQAGKLFGLSEDARQNSFTELLEVCLNENYSTIDYKDFTKLYSNNPSYYFLSNYGDIKLLFFANTNLIRIVLLSDFSRKVYEFKRTFAEFEKKCTIADLNYNYLLSDNLENKHLIFVPNAVFFDTSVLNSKQKLVFTNSDNLILFFEKFIGKSFHLLYRFKDSSELQAWKKIFDFLKYKTLFKGLFMLTYSNKKWNNVEPFDLRYFSNLEQTVANKDVYNFDNDLKQSGLFYRDGVICGQIKNKSYFNKLYLQANDNGRKLIINWLIRNYGKIQILENITLERLINNLPSNLSDLYFALSLRGNTALLFFTVYDLRERSLDIEAYFSINAEMKTPFGVQVSQNAIDKDLGYLKLDTPSEFTQKLEHYLIDFLNNNPKSNFPIWSIGIDHASSIKDSPKGKTKEFLKNAFFNSLINSVCLDFETILNNKEIDSESEFVSCLEDWLSVIPKDTFIEIVTGENTNQIDDAGFNKISKLTHDVLIDNLFKNDNFLLGPALGTIHHQKNKNCDPGKSLNIFTNTINNSCLGNVLHGTSFTKNADISQFVKNKCIRVNFAGQYLNCLIEALPKDVANCFGTDQISRKTLFYKNRQQLDALSEKTYTTVRNEIKKLIISHENAMNTITLTNEEIEYLRNPVLRLSENILDLISEHCFIDKQAEVQVSNKKTTFFASMIEVPDEEFINGSALKVYNAGIRDFHIDVGDGNFIQRNICGLSKIEYLNSQFDDIRIHVHIMAKSPHLKNNSKFSLLEEYCNAGIDLIYIYPESFNSSTDLIKAISLIKSYNITPGIIFSNNELDATSNFNLLTSHHIHNTLLMGVVSGRGGQRFTNEVTKLISRLRNLSDVNNYNLQIEVDGGLTWNNSLICRDNGADFLSGWSMFLSNGKDKLEQTIRSFVNEI